MIYLFQIILLMSSVWAKRFYSPVIDPNKFTICTITINSDDEKKIFTAQAAKYPNKFNPVVELTDFDEHDWFNKSCQSGIRCDQLVISGHFGGDFFGDSEKRLSLKELETAGCSKSCEGILKDPYEIFLFGCNTLSGKNQDHRTPAQYLQVLLNDGISLERAEMVVESRYGAIGDSHKGSMQRAFSGGHKKIYGFDSVGPSGKTVKPFLQNYFNKIKPVEHLEKLQAQRMLANVNWANDTLADSLKGTAFTQCDPADLADPAIKSICKLQDETVSVVEKLALSLELLTSNNYLTYLPAMNNFFKAHNPKYYYSKKEKDTFAEITKNTLVKDQILDLIKKNGALGLKSEWSQFAVNLGFMSEEERIKLIKPEVLKMFSKPLTIDKKDLVCSLSHETYSKLEIKYQDLGFKKLGPNEVDALNCLQVKDPMLDAYVLKIFLQNSSIKAADSYLGFLANNSKYLVENPSQAAITKAKTYLIPSSNGAYYHSIALLSRIAPTDPNLIRTLSKFLKDVKEDSKDYVLYQLGEIKVSDPIIQKEMIQYMKSSTNRQTLHVGIHALFKTKTKDPQVLKYLEQLSKDKKVDDWTQTKIINYLSLN